ncbi:MAG: hypothetical protein R2830_18915 [Saprospiraceae bacterium]
METVSSFGQADSMAQSIRKVSQAENEDSVSGPVFLVNNRFLPVETLVETLQLTNGKGETNKSPLQSELFIQAS